MRNFKNKEIKKLYVGIKKGKENERWKHKQGRKAGEEE